MSVSKIHSSFFVLLQTSACLQPNLLTLCPLIINSSMPGRMAFNMKNGNLIAHLHDSLSSYLGVVCCLNLFSWSTKFELLFFFHISILCSLPCQCFSHPYMPFSKFCQFLLQFSFSFPCVPLTFGILLSKLTVPALLSLSSLLFLEHSFVGISVVSV